MSMIDKSCVNVSSDLGSTIDISHVNVNSDSESKLMMNYKR